jgi:phosphate transport system protein
LHDELDLLQAKLMEMAGLAENQVSRAVEAFLTRDAQAVRAIREGDKRIDTLEMEVDEAVVELIALHQPMASDLRQILTTLKLSNDIERVGDHALNIAKAARRLADLPPLPDLPEIMEQALLSQNMLRDALAAFGSRNVGLAREVCARDDRVDDMRRSLKGILLQLMSETPERIPPALEYLRVSQQLERIGDLSTNISEDVVFLVEGRSIKHGLGREMEEKVQARGGTGRPPGGGAPDPG